MSKALIAPEASRAAVPVLSLVADDFLLRYVVKLYQINILLVLANQ